MAFDSGGKRLSGFQLWWKKAEWVLVVVAFGGVVLSSVAIREVGN